MADLSAKMDAATLLPMPTTMVVCLLVNGLTSDNLTACLGQIKSGSKQIGTHARRELFWNAYNSMISEANKQAEGQKLYGFLTYTLPSKAEFIACTKRQKGLLGSTDFMGKKFKPEDNESKSEWCIVYFDDDKTDVNDAQAAFDDITTGEVMVYLSQDMDGVFVGTKLKRRKCRSAPSSPLKSPSDIATFKATLLPDKPLQSIDWTGKKPAKINDYNFVVAGSFHKSITEDDTIPHINTTSIDEIYTFFEAKRNVFLISEAEKLIASHLTDVGKGLANPLCNLGLKNAAIARRNALMKKCYICSSKKKFIDSVLGDDDNNIELIVINNASEASDFVKYGAVVFELHYRADLTVFG